MKLPTLGCCGWVGAQSAYFATFPSIEIQSTFYDPPSVKVAARWRSSAPVDFVFCMKAWQLITHTPASPTYRRLKVPVSQEERDLLGSFRDTEPVWRAWERTRQIADALQARVVVFQCPASFGPSPENVENLAKFFRRLGPQPFQLAWEPRGPAWPPALVHDLCSQHRLVHCVDPFVNLPVYGEILYWRLHGRGSYFYRYTDEDLAELKRMFTVHQTDESYVMFNNVPMKEDAERFRNLLRT